MKIVLFCFATLSFFACSNKTDTHNKEALTHTKKPKIYKQEPLPTFLLYGELMPIDYIEDRDTLITQKYGFNLKRVAYCDVTNELIDSVKVINTANSLKMQQKHGKQWIANFETKTHLKVSIPNVE